MVGLGEETDTKHVSKYLAYIHYEKHALFFWHAVIPRMSFLLALSAAGQTWRSSAHYDACLDPGRPPWRSSEQSTTLSWLLFIRGCVPLP